MRPILAAAILLSFAASRSLAEPAPNLRVPTSDEMKEIADNCPDYRVIPAGKVVAYDESFEGPLLVGTDQGRILVDGVQVVPPALRDPNFKASKITGELHSQFYLDEKDGVADASKRIEERLNQLKADRAIDDFKVWKRHGKLASFQVQTGGQQSRVYLDALPQPLIQKYQFFISAYFRCYLEKKEADGPEPAQSWLKSRLDELKAAGKIDALKWDPEREVAGISFPGETAPRDYPFGEDRSPFGVAMANRWKARHKETQAAVLNIVGKLKAGKTLRYSYAEEMR